MSPSTISSYIRWRFSITTVLFLHLNQKIPGLYIMINISKIYGRYSKINCLGLCASCNSLNHSFCMPHLSQQTSCIGCQSASIRLGVGRFSWNSVLTLLVETKIKSATFRELDNKISGAIIRYHNNYSCDFVEPKIIPNMISEISLFSDTCGVKIVTKMLQPFCFTLCQLLIIYKDKDAKADKDETK